MVPPKISIIIVHQRYGMTASCLQSLRRCSYSNIEVIVVDQGTIDGSADRLLLNFPEVIVVPVAQNIGFTGGYNAGMREATGRYLLLLDHHTIVHPGFLEPLLEALDTDPVSVAASPLIRFFSMPSYIHYAGGPDRIDLICGHNPWRGWNTALPHRYTAVEATTILHGAAIMVKREVCQMIGKLDERFVSPYMEIEWSIRMRQSGLRTLFVPQSQVLLQDHTIPSSERSQDLRIRQRSRMWLSRKHLSTYYYVLSLLYVWIFDFPKALMGLIARSNIREATGLIIGSLEGTFAEGS